MPRKNTSIFILSRKSNCLERIEDDLQDIPSQGVKLSAARRNEFLNIKKQGKWKDGVRSYLASISFADAQLGRLLDALGEKLSCGKYNHRILVRSWLALGGKESLAQEHALGRSDPHSLHDFSPRVDQGGTRCSRPVDTLCVFPTLVELCGLKPRKDLDGVSIVPLLKNPEVKWDLPAVTEYKRGQRASVFGAVPLYPLQRWNGGTVRSFQGSQRMEQPGRKETLPEDHG